MDPVELLDILGNENRRRILQLLSFRPFYFNEMAKRLDVGPKAVIDHLEMLERAGLIECYRDNRRRKYFRIAENLVLEVAVSPHAYGVRTYKFECAAAQDRLGGSSEQVALGDEDLSPEDVAWKSDSKPSDLERLRSKLGDLEEKRLRLRRLLEEVESEEMEIKRMAIDLIEGYAEDQLEAEILTALVSGTSSAKFLADRLRMPPAVVEDVLKRLAARGKVQKKNGLWSI